MSTALLFDLGNIDTPFARVRVVDGKAVVVDGDCPADVLEKVVLADGPGGPTSLSPEDGDIWLQAWAESFDGVIAGLWDPAQSPEEREAEWALERAAIIEEHEAQLERERAEMWRERGEERDMLREAMRNLKEMADAATSRPVNVVLEAPRQRVKVTEYITDEKGRIIGKREREEDGSD